MEKFDAYQMVTDRITALLEQGLIPWARPWSSVAACAWSHNDGRQYSLINQMLLADPNKKYSSMAELLKDVTGEWITFEQAKKEGGHVKKGAKGRPVVFFKVYEKKTEETDENGEQVTQKFPVLKRFTVFRVADCEGIKQRYNNEETSNVIPADATADSIAADYVHRFGITCNEVKSNRAYYSPAIDTVVVPLRSQFSSSAEFYSTLYHELTHSTGHKDRLNRLTKTAAFGNGEYSTEELTAEIGAASILATLGIETAESFRNSVGYIQGWLKALKDDKKMIVVAAARAEKAIRLILGID